METSDPYRDGLVKPCVLDEAFGELMDQSVGALPQVETCQEPRRTGQRRRSSVLPDLGGRISRSLMRYLGQFCMVDLYGGRLINNERNHEQQDADGRSPPAPKRKESDQHRKQDNESQLVGLANDEISTNATSWPWWPRTIRCIYLYCAIKMLVTLINQYRYDFNLTRYERLKSYLSASGGGGDLRAPKFYTIARRSLHTESLGTTTRMQQDQVTLDQYADSLAQAKRWLRLLGAPYMHLKFSIECTYVFFLLVSFGLYIQTQLFFTHVHPFDFALVRSIMDFRRELRLCNRLIRWQLNKFIESSRMFTLIALANNNNRWPADNDGRRWLAGANGTEANRRKPWMRSNDDTNHIRRALEDHARTIEQVKRMALSGALMPANKRRDWVRQLAHVNCLYTALYLLYCLFIGIILAAVLPNQLGARIETDPMDLVTALELLFLVFVSNTSSTFWGSIVLASSLDQVHLVHRLKVKFDKLLQRVNSNSLGVYRLSEPNLRDPGRKRLVVDGGRQMALASAPPGTRAKCAQMQAQMDGDLLELLLSYKIFVAQLEPLKRSYGFLTLTTYTLMILMPVIGRIHVPYVDGRLKLYVGGLSLLCTLVCDLLILIPAAHLYTRCIALHKSLSSVLAHTIEVSQVAPPTTTVVAKGDNSRMWHQQPTTCRARIMPIGYNEHTIFALRKELRHPERLVDQFATTVLGIRLTYSNLLKIHFWIGFITQSFLFESSSTGGRGEAPQDLFGSIFTDPLGLR